MSGAHSAGEARSAINDKHIRSLADEIARVAAQATSPAALGPGKLRFLSRAGVGFTLGPEQVDAFDRVVATLVSFWSTKFSEAYVRSRLDDLLTGLVAGRLKGVPVEQLREIASEFEHYCTVQTVYLPVIGMKLPLGDLAVGNVTLRNADDQLRRSMLESFTLSVRKTKNSPEEQDGYVALLRKVLDISYGDGAMVEYRVVAEPTRALERAQEETRRALEVVRLAVPSLFAHDQRVAIGMPGDVASAITTGFVQSEAGLELNRSVAGAVLPFEVTQERLEYMRRIGVLELAGLLRTEEAALSDLDRALLNAVHWYSAAQMQAELEGSFLALAICVEALLTPGEETPIGTALAEAAAMLLSTELTERRAIRRRFKDLYGKRSKISHRGGRAILESDREYLQALAAALIRTLVARRAEFGSRKALLQYVEDLKLS